MLKNERRQIDEEGQQSNERVGGVLLPFPTAPLPPLSAKTTPTPTPTRRVYLQLSPHPGPVTPPGNVSYVRYIHQQT